MSLAAMMKVPTALLFVCAAFVLCAGVVVAEYSIRVPTEIPGALFFGIPFVGAAIALFSMFRGYSLYRAALDRRRASLLLGAAILIAILPMLLLSSRYRADYDPIGSRVAPDGSAVHSITWSEEGGRYIERLNGRFEIKLTEVQYQEIMLKHQRAMAGVIVVFASLGFLASAALLVLERGGQGNGR